MKKLHLPTKHMPFRKQRHRRVSLIWCAMRCDVMRWFPFFAYVTSSGSVFPNVYEIGSDRKQTDGTEWNEKWFREICINDMWLNSWNIYLFTHSTSISLPAFENWKKIPFHFQYYSFKFIIFSIAFGLSFLLSLYII